MNKNTSKIMCSLALLGIATALFALASPILKILVDEGGRFGIHHTEAISFCNVLFIGNFCAGLISFTFVAKRSFPKEIKSLDRKTWMYLIISCILAIIYPSLVFFALELTSVTHLVLVSRFEGISYLILAFFFLKTKITWAESLGYIFIGLGVIVTLLGSGEMIGKADILILSACVFYGLSEVVSVKLLGKISLPSFIFIRNFFSAIVFFIIATYIFGPHHFADAFHGDLWIAMTIYAAIIIVLGQCMWFTAAKAVDPSWPADFALIIPFFSIFFAYLLLNDIPSISESIAIVVIAIGIVFAKTMGRLQRSKMQPLGVDSGLIGR